MATSMAERCKHSQASTSHDPMPMLSYMRKVESTCSDNMNIDQKEIQTIGKWFVDIVLGRCMTGGLGQWCANCVSMVAISRAFPVVSVMSDMSVMSVMSVISIHISSSISVPKTFRLLYAVLLFPSFRHFIIPPFRQPVMSSIPSMSSIVKHVQT